MDSWTESGSIAGAFEGLLRSTSQRLRSRVAGEFIALGANGTAAGGQGELIAVRAAGSAEQEGGT